MYLHIFLFPVTLAVQGIADNFSTYLPIQAQRTRIAEKDSSEGHRRANGLGQLGDERIPRSRWDECYMCLEDPRCMYRGRLQVIKRNKWVGNSWRRSRNES
ncbi:hypothetical protein F4815DRAFT_477512 [Daldinia loculata]|nr:hypothetical protein F4815DRAFT_477512 [Daldinia loculata]